MFVFKTPNDKTLTFLKTASGSFCSILFHPYYMNSIQVKQLSIFMVFTDIKQQRTS